MVCPWLVIGMARRAGQAARPVFCPRIRADRSRRTRGPAGGVQQCQCIAAMPCPSRRPVVQWLIVRGRTATATAFKRGLAYDTFPTLIDEFSQCDARRTAAGRQRWLWSRWPAEQGHWPDALTDLTPDTVVVIPASATGERLGYRARWRWRGCCSKAAAAAMGLLSTCSTSTPPSYWRGGMNRARSTVVLFHWASCRFRHAAGMTPNLVFCRLHFRLQSLRHSGNFH